MNIGPPPAFSPLPDHMQNFAWALAQAIEGKRIARGSWAKDTWVCYMPPTTIHQDHVNTRTRKFIPEGPLHVQGYFVVYTKTPDAPNSVSSEGTYGKWQPGYVPSTEDTLATDWSTLD